MRSCDPDGSARDTILDACNSICLAPAAPEYLRQCSAHSHHALYAEWQHSMTAHPSLQWNIFFIIFAMLAGAFIMKFFPPEIPYTVGILLVFIVLGLIAERLVVADDCPHHAWAYAAEHEVQLIDGHKIKVMGVDRREWNLFIGSGLHPESFCILGEDGSGQKRRSCGDGSYEDPISTEEDKKTGNPISCKFKFDELNLPFKLSSMHVESVADRHSEVLLADELWTFRCNWLKDMLGLSDIDPHALLVIFLPVSDRCDFTPHTRPPAEASHSWAPGAQARHLHGCFTDRPTAQSTTSYPSVEVPPHTHAHLPTHTPTHRCTRTARLARSHCSSSRRALASTWASSRSRSSRSACSPSPR